MFSVSSRIKRRYSTPKDSIYAHRFFSDLASGYSYALGNKGETRDFYSFEPNNSIIKDLLKGQYHNYSSYEIEQIISRIAYSLMAYGRAYLYIHPEYSKKKKDDSPKTQALSSIEIREIKGIIKKKTKEGFLFCAMDLNAELKEIQMAKNQLIIFDIKELGFSKRFFPGILRRLSKCDITAKSTDMITNHPDIYDFGYHSEKKKLMELRVLRKIGWSFGTENLSNSYIMYKKIQEDKLKIRFLDYIVNKINDGLHIFLGDNTGKMVAHINKKDYKQLWNDYSEGKITSAELNILLFRN